MLSSLERFFLASTERAIPSRFTRPSSSVTIERSSVFFGKNGSPSSDLVFVVFSTLADGLAFLGLFCFSFALESSPVLSIERDTSSGFGARSHSILAEKSTSSVQGTGSDSFSFSTKNR